MKHFRGIVVPYRDAPPPNIAVLPSNEQLVILNRFMRRWTPSSGKFPIRAPPPSNKAPFSRNTLDSTSKELFSVVPLISTWRPPPQDASLLAKTLDRILMRHPLALSGKNIASPPPRLNGSSGVSSSLVLCAFNHKALFLRKWQLENS